MTTKYKKDVKSEKYEKVINLQKKVVDIDFYILYTAFVLTRDRAAW